MKKAFDDFIRDRDIALESESVELLTDFVLKYACFYDDGFAEQFAMLPRDIKELSLRRMILASLGTSEKVKSRARAWLTVRGLPVSYDDILPQS